MFIAHDNPTSGPGSVGVEYSHVAPTELKSMKSRVAYKHFAPTELISKHALRL